MSYFRAEQKKSVIKHAFTPITQNSYAGISKTFIQNKIISNTSNKIEINIKNPLLVLTYLLI